MDFSEICIKDKALFDRYLNKYNPQVSELTFTNLFMWRSYYKFRYSEIGNYLCIISVPDNGEPYAFIPVGDRNEGGFGETVHALKEYFAGKGWALKFKKVPEEALALFKCVADLNPEISFDRDNSDYVYLTEDLINLKGKKFDGKRNHINKFRKSYEYRYVPITEELIDECSRIMIEWCEARNCDCQQGDYCERFANLELLNNYNILGCKGALIKVDERYEAFTVGEMLNGDTAVIHIEKASFSINGLYTFINQQFCENEWAHTTYINREQDLGQEGLRKAKLSYNPVKLIGKYTVTMR